MIRTTRRARALTAIPLNAVFPHAAAFAALAILCLPLAGCGAIGAVSRGDVAGSLADGNSARAINTRMARSAGFYLSDVKVEVTQGVALLTGVVPRPEDRIEAERIAWTGERIREVGNEIQVGGRQSFGDSARDSLTAQAVRAALLADGAVRSINYNVEVHDGVAYLLGVAQTGAELDSAAQTAARVSGVDRVVTYVRIDGAGS